MPFIGDEQITTYDWITADAIEEGDQILIDNDPIEVSTKIDEGPIFVSGYSYNSGDRVYYTLTADKEVGLWTA